MNNRLQLLLTQYVDQQKQTNVLLEKIAALLVSNQLLNECVDHTGHARETEQIMEVVANSFSAGLALLADLEQRNRDFDYQRSEFFVETPENQSGDNSLNSF